MKKSWKMKLAVFGGLLAPATVFAQQSVQWDANRAILAGSGCQKDIDSFVSENGNDLAIVFTNLGVDLPGNASRVLSARKTCSARIPATIAPGYYIGELTQRVSFGVTKTAGTRGAVATNSLFFGFSVSPYTVNVPYGSAMNQPLMVQQRTDRFLVRTHPTWYNDWCVRRLSPKGMYIANIAVSGQKDHASEDLIMFVDGLDLKYEVVTGLVKCQL